MPDPRETLQAMFGEANRHASFGEMLMGLEIRGFRGHPETILEVRSPITALCGVNGSGKSTIAELAAAAFQTPDSWNYNISTFFVVGPLDPEPFTPTASVRCKYAQAERGVREITLSRDANRSRWRGYQRRARRPVAFITASIHVPRGDRRDFVVRESARLTLGDSIALEIVREKAANVLGQPYELVESKIVNRHGAQAEVLCAQRTGVAYSEVHMGCGEGRVQALVRRLESMPRNSLIILEEPESALHQGAQYRLGRYLVDLCIRKRHQIILTTHSEHLLRALPQVSSAYLHPTPDGPQIIVGVPPAQAQSMLSEGQARALTVFVEDEVAKLVLSEIVRCGDPNFLGVMRVVVGGHRDEDGGVRGSGKDALRAAMATTRAAELPVAAVLDGDGQENPDDFVFKLPGTRAPERELLESARVADMIQAEYGAALDALLAEFANADEHQLMGLIAERLNVDESQLVGEMARTYAQSLGANAVDTLVGQLEEAANRQETPAR